MTSLKTLGECIKEYISDRKKKSIYCVSFRTKNFGDCLNKLLIEEITGLNTHIVHVNHLYNSVVGKIYAGKTLFTAIGSVMHYAPDGAFVWGTGCISCTGIPKGRQKFLSVRGPMTAKALKGAGIACPDIFGDPALLYRRYIDIPTRPSKRFKIGIIPHMSEKSLNKVAKISGMEGIRVIDIEGSIHDVVESILACEKVFSSSLHGLIMCDVLEVPNSWVRFRDEFPGENFKFNDYYSSVKDTEETSLSPIFLESETEIANFMKRASAKACVHEHHLDLDLVVNVLNEHLKLIGMI